VNLRIIAIQIQMVGIELLEFHVMREEEIVVAQFFIFMKTLTEEPGLQLPQYSFRMLVLRVALVQFSQIESEELHHPIWIQLR